ncbi:MAG: ammonium transporter [Pseudonocardiaceae bacterium]|nr:ammonium transporter [Pseudonocardiaceae bacterium]
MAPSAVSTLWTQGQLFSEQNFPDQVTTNSLVQNVVYASGTVGAIFIVAGLLLVSVGGVRRANVFDAVTQKLLGFFIGFATYFLIGFAIWNWQYYAAFDIANPYWQSISDWWLGGTLANDLAQNVDPEAGMGAALNNQQIFIFFLACFAGIINMLIHFGSEERIKPSAYYIISFFTAIVSSVLSWLTWGSTGPLTNLGYHDFFGSAFVYVFAGVVGVYLSHRVGQRAGMFKAHPAFGEYRNYNLGLTVIGVVVVFAGLPMVILSCGFFFDPEALFVSVNMSDTSIGIAFNNLALSWAGGALTGAVIAYRTKKYIYTLLGPLAGYLSGAPAFDIYQPWQMFLVALVAPLVAYGVYEWTQRRGHDEHKLGPLFIGAASYGIIMVGLIQWGTPQGGYFGIDSGPYAFQHAEVNVLWQLIGLTVAIVMGLVTAAVLSFILERTSGLRVSEAVEVRGFDQHYWDVVHDVEPQQAPGTAVRSDGDGTPAGPEPATTGDGGETQ